MNRERVARRLAALLAFCASLAVYLRTMLPGVGGYGDTSKFQFVGATLGLPHPSGFPTYLFLNALFARLPCGTLAWRINFMSALLGALAVALLALLVARVARSAAAALGAALLFAFSFTFWSTCLIAEVYTLATLFVVATLLCLARWRETGLRRWFYLACLLYAVSFGNHLMVIALLPAFLYFVAATDARVLRSPRALAAVALIVLLGASQYLFILVRSFQGPAYVEGRVGGFGELVWYATGGTFRKHWFEPSLRGVFTVQIPAYCRLLRSQIGVAGIALAAAGFVALIRRERVWGISLLVLYATTVCLYVNGPHIEQPIYFVPATMALTVPLAFAAALLRGGRVPGIAAPAALLCLAAWNLFGNFAVMDLSRKTGYGEAADLVLAAVKPRGIILSPNYHWTEVLLYKLIGEGARAGDGVRVLHHWRPEECARYARGEVDSWDPYAPAASAPARAPLYLFSLEREPRTLARLRGEGWKAVPLIRREHPLVEELHALGGDKMLLAAAKDEGLTILSDEAYDALCALGLKTQAARGATYGWAAGDAVVRGEGAWRGWKQFRYAPVRIRARAGARIPGTTRACPTEVVIECAGYGRGDRNRISVGGRTVTTSDRGLNLAVVGLPGGAAERVVNIPPPEMGALRSIFLYELEPPGDE